MTISTIPCKVALKGEVLDSDFSITDWLYGELGCFFDIPIEALSQEVLEGIIKVEWAKFQTSLQYYPEATQGRVIDDFMADVEQ
ncbi:MAG: hypothetical protein VKJ02_12545 [Snowella sp.]|nr:hypothetical protein [Snowella sp.]